MQALRIVTLWIFGRLANSWKSVVGYLRQDVLLVRGGLCQLLSLEENHQINNQRKQKYYKEIKRRVEKLAVVLDSLFWKYNDYS